MADSFDHAIGFDSGTECGDGEKVSRTLQPTPRIIAIVRVLSDASHCEGVQRLQQECTQPTDEHARICVDESHWSIVGKPSFTFSVQ